MEQHRGKDLVWREPVWDTITIEEPVENAFPFEDIYEENSVARLSIRNVRLRCTSIQARVKVKTMRAQFSLISVGWEVQPRQYN